MENQSDLKAMDLLRARGIILQKGDEHRIWFWALRDIDDSTKGGMDIVWDRRTGMFRPCACTHAIYRKHELDWCYHLKAADMILDILCTPRPNRKYLAARYLKPTSRRINEFIRHDWNSIAHEDAKRKVFDVARSQGYDVIVEGTLKAGGRPDLILLDSMEIVEIMHSETESDALGKALRYPRGFTIYALRADEVLSPEWLPPWKDIYTSTPE